MPHSFCSDNDDLSADFEEKKDDCTNLMNSIEPQDRFRFTYICFYLLGILTLLPWNFFVTANDYWLFKFRDSPANQSDHSRSKLQSLFTSYVSMAATGPSVLFLVLNSLIGSRVSIQSRIISSMTLILLSFLLTTALTVIDTDKWQTVFFGMTLVTVIVVNVCSALLQASLWSLSSKFPSPYTAALISGQALGGIFTATVYILSLLADASATFSALLYFNIANLFIVLSFISFFFTSKTGFFIYHTVIKDFGNNLQYDPTDPDVIIIPEFITWRKWKQTLTKIKWNGFTVFVCFTVTLSAFPGLTVLIISIGEKSKWRDIFFVPVISFLLYNIWDYIGRLASSYAKSVFAKQSFVVALSAARVVLIPLILFCNIQPRHHVPVFLDSDLYFVTIICILGVTNGFIINTTFINVKRKNLESSEQETAFSIMAIFVGSGCALGAALSWTLIKFI